MYLLEQERFIVTYPTLTAYMAISPLQFKNGQNWLSIEQLVKCINFFIMTVLLSDGRHTKWVEPGSRVWLANLEPKITEFTVLQIIRPFGELEDFEFPVHKAGGPLQGGILRFHVQERGIGPEGS